MKTYSNKYASAEKRADGSFDLFNDVTGLYRGNVKTWQEANAFLTEQKQHYSAVERGRAH